MLTICVQAVNSKSKKQCLKHINLKKEKEQKRTAFWLEVSQKQAETLF